MFRIIRVPAALDEFFGPYDATFTETIGRTFACWSWQSGVCGGGGI